MTHYIAGVITDVTDNSWTAGQRVNITNSPSSFIWRLETANYYATLPISFNAWNRREPDNAGGYQFCLVLRQISNYMWNDADCGVSYHSVCEIDIA